MNSALAVLWLLAASAAQALPITYSVDGWGPAQFPGPITPPADAPHVGDGLGYAGDTVALQGYSGTLDLTPGTTIQQINTLLWTVDYTYAGTETDPDNWSELSFAFTALRGIHLGSVNGSITQDGLLDVYWDNDYLRLSSGPMASFLVDGYQIDVTPLALAREGASNFDGYPEGPWVQPGRNVMAEFTVTRVPDEGTTLALAAMAIAALIGCKRIAGVRTA